MHHTDVLVIGGGIAGLSYALYLHDLIPKLKITVVTKHSLNDSGSSLAQGGIAAVTGGHRGDSVQKHIEDTLSAGDGLCDRTVVEFVTREATARVEELLGWGVRFDTGITGEFDLAIEGGHSARRILHAADSTGSEIMGKLISQIRRAQTITVMENHTAVDLICRNNQCTGMRMLSHDSMEPFILHARITMMATGGIGQVFLHTTNPTTATGDGIVMAWRAGARVADMEFIQFHPTAMWQEKTGTSFLVSEAVRGAGAILRNVAGERFMKKYDPRLELATRDVVARAVKNEMHRTRHDRVFLDCTKIPSAEFSFHFPAIQASCLRSGIDPSADPIPVTPSAHYCCGGIVTGHYGHTSIQSLYAAGECARTGLHGANRLASNSLLEALVFAKRAASASAEELEKSAELRTGGGFPAGADCPQYHEKDIKILREKMSAASIITREEALLEAFDHVRSLRKNSGRGKLSTESVTYGNLVDAAWLILSAWQARNTNAGAYYRERFASLA